MKVRETLITLIALLAIAGTSFWAYRYEHRRGTADTCPFCNRMVHRDTAYRLKVGDHILAACCPRCGMHAQVIQAPGQANSAFATDVTTGESIAAESALYVEGGDVQYCTHGEQPVAREPNGVSVREFDRCLPTLVAFKSHEEAEVYQREHGGRILSYAQALASAREQ